MTITEKERFMKYRMDAMEKRLDMIESLFMQQHLHSVPTISTQPSQPIVASQPIVPSQQSQPTVSQPSQPSQPSHTISCDVVNPEAQMMPLLEPLSIVRRRFIL